MNSYRIGEFALEMDARKLTQRGQDVALGARAFDLLCFLVANRHRVLSKAEMLDAVWPDTAVEESNLTVQISTLRKALGPKALVTIPGRGYQFVLPVDEGGTEATATPTPTVAPRPKILVLPFANTSSDPDQEYFSDGIAEDVINDLSKVSALSVVARSTAFSLKGRAIDLVQVANDMTATHVVEGSVRKSGNRIRINTQLVDGANGHPVWADRFDRDLTDIFALQDEITQAIVTELKVRLAPSEREAIRSRPTDNLEAYETYLQARHHVMRAGRRGFEAAILLLKRALDIDPEYDRAWALLAVCQAVHNGWTKSGDNGLDAAEKALALNPNLAEALAAKGRVLSGLGRNHEALQLHERALQLDPDSFDVRLLLGGSCFTTGRYQAASEHWERAAELSPSDLFACMFLTMCYEAMEDHEKLIDACRRMFERAERAIAEHSHDAYGWMSGALALATLGETERARQWAFRAKDLEPEDPSIDYNIACTLAMIGETEAAIDMLETWSPKISASAFAVWIRNDSDLVSLRDDPRFQRLVADLDQRAAAVSGGD